MERQRRHPVGSLEWLRDQLQAIGQLRGLEGTKLVKDKESRDKFSDLLTQPEIRSLAPPGATLGDVALALEERIRALVRAIPDRNDRRIAEVVFGTEPPHQGLRIVERLDRYLLDELEISDWTYRVKRDKILLSIARSLKEGERPVPSPSRAEIEALIQTTPPGEVPTLDDDSAAGVMAFAADRSQLPFERRFCVDALAAWARRLPPAAEALQDLLSLARNLQREPDIGLAKAGLGLVAALLSQGVADSRDVAAAIVHPTWEVRTEAVRLLVTLDDDYVFESAAEVRLSYWLPLKWLAEYAARRAKLLTDDERAAAITLLTRLAQRAEISEKTRARLLEARTAVEGSKHSKSARPRKDRRSR